MRFSFLPVIAMVATGALAGSTVNFYYDDNCEVYADTVTLPGHWNQLGGPYGSRSAMYTYNDEAVWTIGTAGGDEFMNPRVWTELDPSGQCVAYTTGIYASSGPASGLGQ